MTTIDPRFADQARDFITESIKQEVPEANVDAGSGINAILARGASSISASLFQEIEHMLSSRDLSDPEALSEEDMDLLLSNLLTERDGGSLSYGIVRLYYNERIQREFTAGLTATIETGELNFVTIADLVYNPQDYYIDEYLGLYYINVPFVSEDVGEQYDVEPGEINKLINDTSGALRVNNPSGFRSGADKQTNTQALRLAQRSVSTRTPMSRDGAIYWLQKLFGSKLRDLLIVGNGDDEMLRDEVYDLGEGSSPRFQIGVDSLEPLTIFDGSVVRDQLGDAQGLHVGGRTDVYMLMDAINYVQQHADLFADMTLDSLAGTTLIATFVEGTTGQVPATGRLLVDLGNAAEETLIYTSRTTIDNNTFTFTLDASAVQSHVAGASVKVVNNGEIVVGEDGDITILPVFQIAEIRLLDPVTYEPVGDPVPETTSDSKTPGWYVGKTNPYDLLSARETKIIYLDEKRGVASNAALQNAACDMVDYAYGGGTYWKVTLTWFGDVTGYQGRQLTIVHNGGASTTTRTILQVISPTEFIVSGDALGSDSGYLNIDAAYAEYNQYPVRVSFYTNTEIAEAQDFFDQDGKRILAGDTLARAFMPVFLDFTMQYRGDGEPSDVRLRLNEVLKTSSGEAIGESEGARFEYSDLVAAAYEDDLANYIATPFQVRVRRLQMDGSWVVEYMNPDPETSGSMAIKSATVIGASFVEATIPATVTDFTPPTQGRLVLGGYTASQQEVEYIAVVTDGSDHTFVLKEGETVDAVHPASEPLRVLATDYDDDNLITDGVITDEREYRPFLGNVIIEKL